MFMSSDLIIMIFFIAAFITEIVHSVVGKYIYNFQPLLTRTEVTEFNNSLVNYAIYLV